jgi:DNA transposition AAA+ family ATPase
VTKYLNLDKPGAAAEPDARKVEAAAKQFLRHKTRLAKFNESLFENSVAKNVANVLKLIRRTGDVGLIHSTGGLGKTCGALLYCRENPNTLYNVVRQYACGSSSVELMLFNEFCNGSDEKWPGNIRRAIWLEEQLRGSERLIIWDDAELMDISGFRFAFALHDATGVAMAFIGNTEVIEKIRRNDRSHKMITRIGIVQPVEMSNDAEETAMALIEQFAPEGNGALVDPVTDTVGKMGYCRRARKQLTLASNIKEGEPRLSWPEAYKAAGAKLLDVATKAK